MRMIASLLRAVRVPAALLALASAPAAENNLVGRPVPYYDSGLQLSLTTNTYKVYGGEVLMPLRKERIATDIVFPRQSLIASVMLANRSNSDLTFTFENQAAASRKFDLRVLNAAGQVAWNSAAVAPVAGEVEPETVTAVLKRRSKWSNTLQVPVKIADEWLEPGVYTLEAAIAGEPKIGATTLFEVVEPPVVPPPVDPVPGTGIKGQVLRLPGIFYKLDGTSVSPSVLPIGIKAKLRIVELVPPGAQTFRAPFVYEGETAEDGTFKVDTLTGRFRVTASPLNSTGPTPLIVTDVILPAPPFPPFPPQKSASVETTVTAGAYSDVRLHLYGGVIFEPPAKDTGINGKVTRLIEGGSAPVGGATVVVEEIRPQLATGKMVPPADDTRPILIRPPFRWVGKTNASGEFSLNTPPGTFRVTASAWSSAGPIPLENVETTTTSSDVSRIMVPQWRGTAMVNVAAGSFSDVEVKLLSTTLPATKVLIYAVNSAEAAVLNTTLGPVLRVTASGSVSTGGWSLPELRQKRVTAEGVVEFEFLAKEPTGPVTQVISPVSASVSVPLPANASAVRVISRTNSREVPLGEPAEPGQPTVLQAF